MTVATWRASRTNFNFLDAVTRSSAPSVINASSFATQTCQKFNFNPNFVFQNRSFPQIVRIMRELRELRLPKLIEAREDRMNAGADAQPISPLHLSQSSASLDQTPISPTFSLRGLGKYPSANSSLASSPTMRSSLDDYSQKRPLTEVREEPVQEKEDEFEMVDAFPRDREGKSQYLARSAKTILSRVTTS